MLIIAIILLGVLAGGLAQLILGVPMREIHWPTAFALGIGGSFIGGLLISLLAGDGLDLRPSGIIGSVAGALLLSLGWRWAQRRSR